MLLWCFVIFRRSVWRVRIGDGRFLVFVIIFLNWYVFEFEFWDCGVGRVMGIGNVVGLDMLWYFFRWGRYC